MASPGLTIVRYDIFQGETLAWTLCQAKTVLEVVSGILMLTKLASRHTIFLTTVTRKRARGPRRTYLSIGVCSQLAHCAE